MKNSRNGIVGFLLLIFSTPNISSAAPILFPTAYEIFGGQHGFNAITAEGQHISFGTLNEAPVKVVDGIVTPLETPNGYTELSAGRPSQDGKYSVFSGYCGGTVCSVVYGDGAPRTFTGLNISQVGNNGELVGVNESGQPFKMSLANPTPIILSSGSDIAAQIFALSTTGVSVGSTFSADGVSGKAAMWALDGTMTILNSLTEQAGLVGVSNSGIFGVGFDGGLVSIWNLLTGAQSFVNKLGGGFQEGIGLSVLDDGSASGLSWIYATVDGFSQSPCAFLGNPATIAACQQFGGGISRVTLSQNGNFVGIGGQASILQTTVSLSRFTGAELQNDGANVPEPRTICMIVVAILMFSPLVRRNFTY